VDVIECGGRRFTVGRARRDDVGAIVALLRDDPLGAGREAADDLTPYLAAFDRIDADDHQLLAVARDDDTVVATLQLSFIASLSRGGALRMQVEAVRVAAAVRSLGLGAALFDWAHDVGRSRGAVLSQLTTDRSRADAHRFYERLGYADTHVGLKRLL
jgi:GNAT superfamily N-acetyltransferase